MNDFVFYFCFEWKLQNNLLNYKYNNWQMACILEKLEEKNTK